MHDKTTQNLIFRDLCRRNVIKNCTTDKMRLSENGICRGWGPDGQEWSFWWKIEREKYIIFGIFVYFCPKTWIEEKRERERERERKRIAYILYLVCVLWIDRSYLRTNTATHRLVGRSVGRSVDAEQILQQQPTYLPTNDNRRINSQSINQWSWHHYTTIESDIP
jgi:hypothetical protein